MFRVISKEFLVYIFCFILSVAVAVSFFAVQENEKESTKPDSLVIEDIEKNQINIKSSLDRVSIEYESIKKSILYIILPITFGLLFLVILHFLISIRRLKEIRENLHDIENKVNEQIKSIEHNHNRISNSREDLISHISDKTQTIKQNTLSHTVKDDNLISQTVETNGTVKKHSIIDVKVDISTGLLREERDSDYFYLKKKTLLNLPC